MHTNDVLVVRSIFEVADLLLFFTQRYCCMSDTVSENFETFIILYLLEVKLLGSIDINENLFIQWISFTFFIPDRINHYNVITWWQYDVFHVEREQKRATEARSYELI